MKQSLRVQCQSINESGQGQAQVLCNDVSSNYKKIFAYNWLPQEWAVLQIIKERPGYALANIVQRQSDHPLRAQPACPVFGICGGCQIQHSSYDLQLQIKHDYLKQLLLDAFLEPDKILRPIHPSQPWRYRYKLIVPFQMIQGRLEAGFYATSSQTVVPTDACKVQTRALELVWQKVLELARELQVQAPCDISNESERSARLLYFFARESTVGQQVHVTFIVDRWDKQWQILAQRLYEAPLEEGLVVGVGALVRTGSKDNKLLHGLRHHLIGKPFLRQQVLGISLECDPLAFFQVNPLLAERVWQQMLDELQKRCCVHILELYCGCGVLSLCLAKHHMHVRAVDIDAKAIEWAKKQAKVLGLDHLHFYEEDAQLFIKGLQHHVDAIVVNPPRKGLPANFIECLTKARPRVVLYMACGQPALIRDAKLMQEAGYKLMAILPYDLFPQTMHLESLAIFEPYPEEDFK